jgi:fermentation-respiration switch protein FrsA (DUF1100 family)
MRRYMIALVLVPVLLLAALAGWMYLQQPAMIFFPERRLVANPGSWGLVYEDVTLVSADGVRLHGWWIPHAGASRSLLFFHGNAGNISHRGASVDIFHRLGWNIFIFDYRGYGHSDGRPDEAGLYRDGAAAWRYLTETRGLRPRDIVIFGRSLGGAVATYVAAHVDANARPAGLILESTFSSARDMAHRLFPTLAYVLPLQFDFDSASQIRQVSCPVLVLHSPQDEVIPYALGQRLFQAANSPKRFVELRGGHNDGFLLSQPVYQQALAGFDQALP